jgi:ABC-type sugar transport system ATPase subunit
VSEWILEATGISKSFPGVRALESVDFALRGGEVHALVGENGAGKSTLIKILCGVYQPDTGEITVDGQIVTIASAQDAQRLGIAPVHQEIHLVPLLSVA